MTVPRPPSVGATAARRLLCVAGALLLFVGVAAAREPAGGRAGLDLSRPQPLSVFRPTQMSYGAGLVQYLTNRWEQKAADRGQPLGEFLQAKAARAAPVPVVVAPSGALMALDRHHHIEAFRTLSGRTGADIRLPVKVVRDYTGVSKTRFAENFIHRLRQGYFPPALRKLSAVERMKALPKSFDKMHDDPVRAAVGIAFRQLGLNDLRMRNYAELRLGELLVKRGLGERAREMAGRSGGSADPSSTPMVRAARDMIVSDRKIRQAVVGLGLKKHDRHEIARTLRKAS